MNFTAILIAALVVGVLGIVIGFFLGVSGEKLKVEVDPREEEIIGVLPGNNCGGADTRGAPDWRRPSWPERLRWDSVLWAVRRLPRRSARSWALPRKKGSGWSPL